ncbi:MAG: hypothetical protein C0625_15120 [Arcobacter sp.]|nr:MAG: hypothetical protein C0625_15120 [Arcobacter sp.]
MKKFILLMLFLCSYSFAFEKISIGYGGDTNDVELYNIALHQNLDYQLIDNTNLTLEVSAEYVNGKDDDLFIISTQPMLSYDITDKLYIEGGVGIAYFSENKLDEKRFGMSFQFKESLGFGYRFSENLESTLKYTHYSNADLDKNENTGLDLVMLKLVYKF